MKKVITLTESELVNMIGRIVEDVETSHYDDSDFINAFITLFKPWVIKNHGEELENHPPSYLFKKYSNEFKDYLKMPEDLKDDVDSPYGIGKYILQKELYSYKNLKQTEKFTEKYKKPLQVLIDGLNLPDYLSIELKVDIPYQVYATINVDFSKLLEDNVNPITAIKPPNYLKHLQDNIVSFLGPQIGESGFGELEFHSLVPQTNSSVTDWVKNVFNKEIKEKIRNLPGAKENLHSIKFLPSLRGLKGNVGLSFKTHYWGKPSRKFNRNDFVDDVQNLLKDMGYNENLLTVYY